MGLQRILCIHIMTINLVFSWDYWLWEWVDLWLLCLFLGIFSSYLVAIVNFSINVFASSYILFCHVWLLYLINPLFSKDRQKGIGSRGKGGRKELGVLERREHIIWIYYIIKESILNKRKNICNNCEVFLVHIKWIFSLLYHF